MNLGTGGKMLLGAAIALVVTGQVHVLIGVLLLWFVATLAILATRAVENELRNDGGAENG